MKVLKYLVVFSYLIFISACSKQKNIQLFEKLSPSQTKIDFANNITETPDFNILDYLYFYNVGVS